MTILSYYPSIEIYRYNLLFLAPLIIIFSPEPDSIDSSDVRIIIQMSQEKTRLVYLQNTMVPVTQKLLFSY